MTLRATVRDGLIVVNTHGAIADGTTVEISVPPAQAARRSKPKRSVKPKKKAAKRGAVPGFGMWSDWNELGPADEAVDRLRAMTRRRRVG